jgi:hypothetical protein
VGILLLLLLLLTLPAAVEAQFTCTTNNGTITITGYTGPGGAVTIPNVINGYPVTAIGFGAFFNCTSLTSVSIGTSVTSIGGRTFENCTNLTSITIPDSVASIGELTFAGCDSLTNVWIGVNLTSIGSAAFDYCRSLTAITVDALNSSYSSVDGVLFNKSVTTLVLCPRAKAGSYVIPNSVIGIGDYSFSDCPCLTSITIPDSVVSIGLYAFGSCTKLSSVSMGNGVKSIGAGAFNYCSMLTNVTIGSGVTSLGVGAFQYCTGLTSVTIPGSVSSIGGYAFSDCPLLAVACFLGNAPSADSTVFQNGHATVYYLSGTTGWGPTFGGRPTALWPPPTIPFVYTTNGDFTITIMGYTGPGGAVTIPDTINGLPVTGIESNTFWYCTSLTSVTVPSSVTSIGDAAFGWCTSLTNATISNGLTSIRDQTFYMCTNLASVTIPNSVTNIGDSAFCACTSLTGVTIPGSVTSIGDYAFVECRKLTGVYFLGNAPSLGGSSVFLFDILATVYYLPGTTGWGSTFGGLPTALWQSPPPGPWTLSASTITTTGATLNGTVNPNGSLTAAWFQWGTTTDYGNLTPAIGMGSGTNALPLSAPLAGLTPGVTYHYRVAATNSNGAGYSSDGSFTTLGPPEVWTLSATAVTATNALLNGTVNPNGYPTTAWFQWGTTTSYGNLTAATDMGSGTSDLPLSLPLDGLTLGVTYHFRIAATNDNGTVYGSDQSFTTTASPPPEVYTLSATAVSATTATLNGTVNPRGYPTGAWFQWGTTTNYGNATTATGMGSGTDALPLSAPLAGLTPGTIYHFRAAATNSLNPVYGGDQSFTTATSPTEFNYTTNNGTITITGYTGPGGAVIIPNVINGYPVTAIGESAFISCPRLTSVTIPDSVASIGDYAFWECFGLTNVSIGINLTSIEDGAFEYCTNLTAITVDALNSTYSSADGVLFDKSQTALILCPEGKPGSYIIPNSVNEILDSAFDNCASLTSVTIPDSVTSLRDLTFRKCASLTSVTIPNSVTSIGQSAFAYCTSLPNITIPNSVTSLGDGAFDECTSLTNVTISDSVTSIGDGSFEGCTCLTSATIPDSVTSIGGAAFFGCTSLTNVTIGTNVTSIGGFAFGYCTRLTIVTIPDRVTSIGDGAFYYCTSLRGLYFQGNAPSLVNGSCGQFQGDQDATVYYVRGTTGWGATFGGLPTALWQSPAPGAWTLSASTIPPTGATLNGTVNPNGFLTAAWFQWGTTTSYGNLTPVAGMGSGTSDLPLSMALTGLTPGITYHFRVAATNDNGLAYGSDQSFTTLGPLPQVSTLPATGVSTNSATLNGTVNPNGWPTTAWFQWGATTNYGNVTSVTDLGSGTNALPLSAPLAGLTSGITYHFCVAATNGSGLIYGSDQSFTAATSPTEFNYTITNGTITITGYTGPGGEVTIPSTIGALPVTGIGPSAFWACQKLTSISIPNSVSSIGEDAFFYCSSLATVALGNGLSSIGASAFWGCSSLTSVMIPNSVTTIGDGAFGSCAGLTAIDVDGSNSAFSSVDGVLFDKSQATLFECPESKAGAYTIPKSVTNIRTDAFFGCSSLTSISIPNSVTSIGDSAFWDCSSLSAIQVDALNSFFSSVDGVLFDKSQTTLLQYPEGKGGSYTMPSGVTSIGIYAFWFCTSLTSVTIPNSVTDIGYEAFIGCIGLKNLTIGNHVTSVGDFQFEGCTNLMSVTILDGVTSIGINMFEGCTSLTTITIPGSVRSIGDCAFYKCSGLTNVTIGMGVAGIGAGSFGECLSLTSITIPSSVSNIGDSAFEGCTSLTTLHFGGNAPSLGGSSVFAYDNNATVYYLPGTTGWGASFGGLPTALWHSPPPGAGTLSASAITTTGATLNGMVNPYGFLTAAWFQWGTTTDYGNLTPATGMGSGTNALPLSAPLADLTPGATYHFRVAATNDNGLAYGSDQSFTTQAQSGGAGWTLNGGATMTGNTIALTVGAGNTSRSAFLNNPQDITAFHIVFFYQDVSGAGSADGVTFCIQNDPRGATALGGGSGGSSLGYDNITPSVALAMNIYDPYTRGIAFAQNGTRGTPYQSLLPNVDIGGNTNIIQVNVDYNGTVMTTTFKDTVTGGIASTNWTVDIPSVVGGSTAYVGFTGADGGVASIQTISWFGSTPTILIPPRTQTAEAGSAVGLSVHASGALPLSFLWYFNDTNLISWSTNSDLELTNVQISDSGAYTVVVTNVAGAVTSAPVLVSVIAAVERRPVPGVKLMGEAGSLLSVDYATSLSPAPNWTTLISVSLTSTSQYYFDLTIPLPPQRYFRAWQTGTPSVLPSLDLHLVPAITLTGNIGGSVRLDYINRFGPTDAWVTLDTVTLTNTPQLYFDISAPGQPQRLYRLVQMP